MAEEIPGNTLSQAAAADDCKIRNGAKEIDIFRDTWIRYLGYANEVGEAFRSIVPVTVVRLSYVVAGSYVIGDSIEKGSRANEIQWKDKPERNRKIFHAVTDCLIWQGLASVAIPGFTINRLCALSLFILRKSTSLPLNARKWTTTAIGLSAIPFIIKPIDRSVDYMMDHTLRRLHESTDDEKKLMHHER
ncbi:mitochondrial fission process protein 1-like [Ptychodera flava]|uniref:mitochondrial fission process protein 1-like n=1 Tax=Ptychodera flava TaxID=63121 RepID=UPI00396A16D1